ncbi:hypothetical protein FSP39_000084 [Pinctada imbricata]|uniref:AAA+ ATPase domain-containing protein n=1 Tax=Pinctada imbricata TaxID=66713 RepID=A0AA89C2M6_PINIB|nr:hypothetical protein FSP39_000084 [Pinctada imbricata]
MAEPRGESRGSYHSQSQYSESTVINQDIADPDLFQQDVFGPKNPNLPHKVVTFAPNTNLERAKTVEELASRPLRVPSRSRAHDLMARLVDKPDNSQALRLARGQPIVPRIGAPAPVVANAAPGLQSPVVPRPPSGSRPDAAPKVIRTTMFKKDYERRQQKVQEKSQQPAVLTVGMLHKHSLKRSPTPSETTDYPASEDAEELEVLAELVDIMGPGTETSTIAKSESVGEGFMIPTPLSEVQTPGEKVESSAKGHISEAKSEFTETSAEFESPEKDGEESEVERLLKKYPGEIPIIDTQKKPTQPEVKAGRPTSGTKKKPLLVKDRQPSAKKDMSAVLSYMKKNKYDDAVPENDDVIHNLHKLRERLGWKTELPALAPGCRDAMEKLTDLPKDDKERAKCREDDGEFMYCLSRDRKNKRAQYDPYNLQVVSANEARKNKEYWTISASFVTKCIQFDDHDESVNTPVLWWLWERRKFYLINKLSVFVKFRLWKTFKLWRRNVRLQKSVTSRDSLCKTLFVANEILQGCLVHVRKLCEYASGSLSGLGEGQSAVSLLRLDKHRTLTLTEFIEVQADQGKVALKQLNDLRQSIIDLVWESCATVAEMEGITTGIRPEGSKKVKIKAPIAEEVKVTSKSKLQAKYGYNAKSPLEKKKEEGPKKPLYAEIIEWRKILQRLASFLKLIDYQMLEMLRRLVLTAVRHLADHLVTSYNVTDEDEEKHTDSDEDFICNKELQTSVYFYRPVSQASHKVRQPKVQAKEEYDIPKFDFDQPELVEGPPDIDEVLQEIKTRDIVEEIVYPVFSVQLVLNVNKTSSHSREHRGSEVVPPSSSIISSGRRHLEALEKPDTSASKKTVTFTDDHEVKGLDGDMSGSDQEYERPSREEEYSGEESDYSSEEEKAIEGTNRFKYAYSDEHRKGPHKLKAFVTLSPTEHEFKDGIKNIISGFENTIAQIVSMLREPRLKVFYSPPTQDLKLNFDIEEELEKLEYQRPWPDLEFIFDNDPEYQRMLGEIGSYMTMELELVKQYSANFDQYCGMVDKCQQLNVEESMAKHPWSTDEFSHVLPTHTDMIRAMKKMTVKRRVAMIEVQSSMYRDSCLPYPEAIIHKTHEKLPLIANKRNEDLITIIKGASKKLDNAPKTVEDFVEHLSFLSKMTSEITALEKEFLIVTKLFTIAKDYQVKIEPEDLALYRTLGDSFQHLKNTILFCEAKKDENIRHFSRDLDTLIFNIRTKLLDIMNRVRDPDLLSTDMPAVAALSKLDQLNEEVQILSGKARSYASYQERFGSSLSQSKKNMFGEEYLLMDRRDDQSAHEIQADLSDIERDLTLRRLLWHSQEEWTKLLEDWKATAFDSLPVEFLQKTVNRFTQTVYMLEKGLPHNEVLPTLKEKVVEFKQGMPVITSLRNPSLKHRHWEEIERLIEKSIARDKAFTLANLLEMNIFKHKESIQDISTRASNEYTLEVMLDKIIAQWQTTDFRLVPHAGRDTFIIGGADDIMAQLEESLVTIGTIKGSRYIEPIKQQVLKWEGKLGVFSKTLDEWLSVQRNWLYLEQIFSTPDIQRQLPGDSKMFSQVDKSWKDIMRRVQDRPNALKAAIAPGISDTLTQCSQTLEKIQKSLEDYLEQKRLVFPRFYFLSNDELLDILAQSKDPNAVQPHLSKCFGNIKSLDIGQNPPTIRSIMSAEGEVVPMPKNYRARGTVETWLVNVELGMFETVKKHLKLGLADWLGSNLQEWVLKHPGQVVLTVSQILFNKDVVRCFDLQNPQENLIEVKNKMVDTLNTLALLVSGHILPHQRESIMALLTINVHNRDILIGMIEERVEKKDDFSWTKQLRYEWEEQSNQCLVMQSNASFQYGYEYLGCSPRLVITPLTDRCYLTLTGALHLHLGGSPAGPAGTGKTETVKDLAKAIGKQCVVFNCSEGLKYHTLGKFFSGLAQSGSWCCFDEFNRIDIEVLSVVAQQIHTIKTAKDQQIHRFMFDGKDIKLNMTCGYFITMNPTYAGRVELPDNLQTLFRPVAMMVPHYEQIAEIMLFSEGFMAAKSLSRKIVNLYQLASRQLSQQDHYDFGMRAIKSVLVMAGHGRHKALTKRGDVTKHLSEDMESYILIHSLRDANLPKFLAEDVPLFESILADLFPGIQPPEPDFGNLEKAITNAIREFGLQNWPTQVEKVKQFYNQIMVRHGVMLVGPTGGGKTTVRNILQKALILLPTIIPQSEIDDRRRQNIYHGARKKGHVEVFSINPKCVELSELFGDIDPNTREWSDGLIAKATRKFSKDVLTHHAEENRPVSTGTPNPDAAQTNSDEVDEDAEHRREKHIDWRWMVLDGPVDTLWVENLNTVLDDSKVLCLASGERISLASGMRLIFEVDNLSQASPATISRCAMVYMDPIDLGWRPFVKTWLQRLPRDMPESGKRHLQQLFEHSIEKGMKFSRKHHRFQTINLPEMSHVTSLCHILTAFFDFMAKHGGFGSPDKEESTMDSDKRPESRSSSRSSSRASRLGKYKKKSQKKSTGRGKDVGFKIDDTHSTKSHSSDKQYYLQKNPGQLITLIGKLYVFAYTWSLGGMFKRQEDADDDDNVNRRGQDKVDKDINICNEFDSFMHDLFEVEPPLGVRLPTGNKSIYAYFIDMESGNFVPWDVLVPKTKSLIEKGAVITIGETMGVSASHKKKRDEAEITPTVDLIRFSFLTALLLTNKQPVLLTGESGVGKSAIINHMLENMSKDGGTSTKSGTVLGSILNYSDKSNLLLENITKLTEGEGEEETKTIDILLGTAKPKTSTGIISSMIQFSAQTLSSRLQSHIMIKLIKKGKDSYGAPKGRKKIVFVDDLNMPAPEMFGAQPPLELLRQFLELGGFYDTTNLCWFDIYDVNVVAACGPPGGGRNNISPRLLKHFCTFALPTPSTRSLQHIYQVQLGRFFQEGEFATEVTELQLPLVSAAIAVYYRMNSSMLPTPTKSHYTFNLRDLSKVIQGLLQAHESVIVSKDNMAQLFGHECTRVFHDRLISHEDRDLFFQFLSDNLHDYFKVKWSKEKLMKEQVLFGDFFEVQQQKGSASVYHAMSDRKKLATVLEEYYMRMNYGNTKASQMVFFKDAVEHVTRAARVFRQPGGHMMLVGMDGTGKSTVVQLASHIAGCELFKLTLHRGYGTTEFRDDLKKVFIQSGVKGQKVVFLLTDSDIVKESFLEDINCILNSGEVPDLFDKDELDSIRMDLKQAAADADIPDTEEFTNQFFIHRVRQNLHVVLTMSPAGGKFRQRCRMNPALINCCTIDWYDEWEEEAMLSVASVFFSSAEFIADEGVDIEELKKKVGVMCVSIHKSIAKISIKFWEEMRRHYYSTPSSYMELIRLYAKMLKDNKKEFMNNKGRLEHGLTKLSEANSSVGIMQEELVSLGPRIEEKQKDTEILLEQLKKDQEAVEQVREIVEQEEGVMKRETQIVQDYADECQRDLSSVIPTLIEATEALDTLDKAAISEIRVYINPPFLVMNVMAAVCVLLQRKPDWQTSKQLLGDPNFLKKLKTLDKDSLPDKVFHKLKKISKNPDFKAENVGKVSEACKSICAWVLALEHYNDVYKMVKPKQRRVEDAKEALLLAQESLEKKQASLRKIQGHLDTLQQQYTDSVNQREMLKQQKITTGLRLKRASILIDALANEKVRWQESVKKLEKKLSGLVGDTLVAAASVVYIGPFTAKYRKDLIGQWMDMCYEANTPITKDFDLVKNTVDAYQILKWQNKGLPQDNHSTENAVIVKRAQKWPLFIDPQGQALNYIKERKGEKLKIVDASDPNYMRTLEDALRVGFPMLLKDVGESLDPALRPVLLHETFQRGGHTVIKLGDTEIEYNDGFRLYMTTSMANPHYLPAVYIQVNIINFTVTFEGLQEQLLSAVVRQEKPILETQRSDLLGSIADDVKKLRDLEDRSLSLLQSTKGHILDDQDLVDTLQQSKGKSEAIHKRVAQSEETEKKLSLARKRYLPVATRGATLYFVLADLSGIDIMYQFSLDWFKEMFITCIANPNADGSEPAAPKLDRRKSSLIGLVRSIRPGSRQGSTTPRGSVAEALEEPTKMENPEELKKHMLEMINRLTSSIYRVVSVALFANHQLTFSFMLCSSIMRSNDKYEDITTTGKVTEQEWLTFLQGNILANMMDDKALEGHDGLTPMERLEMESKSGDLEAKKTKTPPKWISNAMWRQCQHLDATMPAYARLCRSIMTNKAQWETFRHSEDIYKVMSEPFKNSVEGEHGIVFEWERLTAFQRLVLIKILHLSAMTSSIAMFVQQQMGASFLSTGTFDLKDIFEDSSPKTPLIFILSPGTDPTRQLYRFASELRGSSLHLDMISLGRDQGDKAEKIISKAKILKGKWVFLQNCHLAASWMPRLQAIVEKLNTPGDEVDPQFRLFLSSKPDTSFPISILQTGLKMTVEPPQGLKANMLRTYGSGGTGVVTEKMFADPPSPMWSKLLFGLCLFNAVIHERKKYGRLGWNITYGFNDSDLDVSILQLHNLLVEHSLIPWDALTFLIGEVTYGGRVTDEWDMRCLGALLERFFCAQALQPEYSYSADGIYRPVKADSSFTEVVSYLESLPNYDSPELFGMTTNAEKACRELQATDLMETINSVQPRLSLELMGSEKSNDEIVLEMVDDIQRHLPHSIEDYSDVRESQTSSHAQQIPRPSLKDILFKEAPEMKDKEKEKSVQEAIDAVIGNSALMTVLRQEVDRFNKLLHIIHKSLKSLVLAIKGEVIMSETLEEAYSALLSQKVPQRWKDAAYESCKPLGSWIQDLGMRVEFFSMWADLICNNVEKIIKIKLFSKPGEIEEEDLLRNQPRAFWLSGFFFPQGFLTGVQQNHARKLEISVDSLEFKFNIMPKPNDTEDTLCDLKQKINIKDIAFKGNNAPEDGVLVFGLHLDGAMWDLQSKCLEDLRMGDRFSRLPEIHFQPVQIAAQDIDSSSKSDDARSTTEQEVNSDRYIYKCPLYRTSERTGTLSSTGISTNFVTAVELPSQKTEEFWVLRGVAMLCQLDD